MNLKKIAKKGILGLLIVMLTAQGWLTGWSGVEQGAYAANELIANGIINTIPAVKGEHIDASAPLVIEFAKPVQKAADTQSVISIKRVNDDSLVSSVAVSSPNVTVGNTGPITDPAIPPVEDGTTTPIAGAYVTIQPEAPLPGGTYYVQIDAKSFVYADDNAVFFAGLNKEWTFRTSGIGSTSIVSKVPQNAANQVTPSSSLTMTFNQPVDMGAGKLQIFQGNISGTPFEEIPITSGAPRITGLKSRIITIDPVKNFNSNSTYYIVMPEGFLRDMNGNDISAISGMDWGFNVLSDPTSLTVSSLSPTNGTTNVSLTGTLTVTFNKELDLNFTGKAVLKKANGAIVESTTNINSSNNRQLLITPVSALDSNMNYVVDIPANTFRDKAGNTFAGLNGSTSWAFKTLSKDTTAPVLKNAKMHSNNTIRLTYDEWLYSTNSLSSSYTVTVNGENRNVSSTYISGDSVYVVLDTGVAVGQVVRIAYAPGTGNRLTDQSLNAAAAFGARDVENSLDSVMSKPREGSVYYSTITLYYPETVYITSSDAVRQFSVTADQSAVGINSISVNNSSVVTLNLSRSITDGEVVRVAYTPGSWPVKDTRGQALAGFSGFYVRNTIDTKPPEFKSAEVSGNKLWIRYNEPLKTTNKPLNSQYSVLVDGKPLYVTDSIIEDDLVTLTLASAVKDTQNISLSYVPGALRLTDLNNNPAGYLNLTPVTYTYGNGKILSATLQGDTVQINFRDAIQSQATLTVGQFSVVLGNSSTTVLSASASGSVVTLKLDTSTSSGATTAVQTGTVSYVPGAVPLRDSSNVTIAAFGPLTLQQSSNSSGSGGQTGTRPAWLEELDSSSYGQSLLVMNNNTASAVSAVSRNNRSTRQFNVDATKLIQTFEYASTVGKLSQPVVIEIPDSESSAYVGFPLNALIQIAASHRTGTIGVKYGDRLWTVPLSNLNLAVMSQNVGAPINTSTTTGAAAPSLYVQLETVPVSSSGSIEGLIAGAGAQKLGNYTDVYVFASNGNADQRVEQNIKSQLAMQLSANTPRLTSGFTYIDPVTFMLSNVPSSFKSTAGGVVVQGQLNGNQSVVPVNHIVSYQDTYSHWASEVINELSAKWIISASNGSFYRPNENISRAEFAELVARGLGLKGEQNAASRFRDVRSGSVTSTYIGAAAEAGIITGNTDGTFKPDRPITREQMAIMMVRALNYGGQPTALNSSAASTLAKFKDNKKIQSKDSVAKAVQEGIIQGMTSKTFEPQGNASRAQAAVMLKRVLDKLGYL